LVATVQGEQVFDRRREAGNAWLAGHLSALSEDDRVALERAVTVLESFTAQNPEDKEVLA
jgi:hypothetical protein